MGMRKEWEKKKGLRVCIGGTWKVKGREKVER